MKNYRKNKLDANQKTVVDHMRKFGAKVEELGDPVDLFIYLPSTGHWAFAEVKIKGSAAKFTRPQILWIANTTLPVAIIKDGDEAMEYLKTGNGVSQKQKDALTGFLMRNQGKYFTPGQIDEVMNV